MEVRVSAHEDEDDLHAHAPIKRKSSSNATPSASVKKERSAPSTAGSVSTPARNGAAAGTSATPKNPASVLQVASSGSSSNHISMRMPQGAGLDKDRINLAEFSSVKLSADGSAAASARKKSNELWFFKFPEDFDISGMQQLSLQIPEEPASAARVIADFELNGGVYTLVEGNPRESANVLNVFVDADEDGEASRLKLGKPFMRCFSIVQSASASVAFPSVLNKRFIRKALVPPVTLHRCFTPVGFAPASSAVHAEDLKRSAAVRKQAKRRHEDLTRSVEDSSRPSSKKQRAAPAVESASPAPSTAKRKHTAVEKEPVVIADDSTTSAPKKKKKSKSDA